MIEHAIVSWSSSPLLALVACGGAPDAPSTWRGAMDADGTDEVSWARDRRVDVMLGT
jgi:hypothetical protein